MNFYMKSKILPFLFLMLEISVCGCQGSQSHAEEENKREEPSNDKIPQVQYEIRFENLVEKEPKLMTYPPTPREIHRKLIEMADGEDKFDREYYDSVFLARKEDTVNRYYYYDMLPVSMLMANEKHYPKAYYDTYIILAELFELDSLEIVSDDVIDLCMFYLIRSAQLGYRPACSLTGIFNDTMQYDHRKLFEKLYGK